MSHQTATPGEIAEIIKSMRQPKSAPKRHAKDNLSLMATRKRLNEREQRKENEAINNGEDAPRMGRTHWGTNERKRIAGKKY